MVMPAVSDKPIALALSGGGIRAMVFHLGVLRCLAERNAIERVHRISSVSGGSLLIGLIYRETGAWPSSEAFLSDVYPSLRRKLCERSLQWGAARQLLRPWNLKYLLSRANLLAMALQTEWSISGRLKDVPPTPEWSINGTTAENGKRFRFKPDSIGDYSLGYADPDDFPLAYAMAVSAAFPGGFGPLVLDVTKFNWLKRPWGGNRNEEVPINLEYNKLHLYDGGVYDNLGLEPLFDSGQGMPKHHGEIIVVSDAGAPLKTGFSYVSLNPARFKRVADIMSDQSRALRVRSFSNYIQQEAKLGAYLYINTPVEETIKSTSLELVANFPTTLRRLSQTEFDAIADHGHKVAVQVESLYGLV